MQSQAKIQYLDPSQTWRTIASVPYSGESTQRVESALESAARRNGGRYPVRAVDSRTGSVISVR